MKLPALHGFLFSGRGTLMAMCVPLLCSCLVGLTGPRVSPLKNVPELPGLAFDQYVVDLREVAPTEEVYAYFGFRNTSPHTVTITKLEPSCGCLQPQLKKRVYKPGECGEFLLRIKTALQRPGFKEFNINVHYTDSKPRTRAVFLRATFPEQQIYVSPMSLTFHQLGTSPVDHEVIVTDLRTNPADIIGVTSSVDYLQLKVLEPVTTKAGARRQLIRVTVPGAVPAGRHEATIKIYTNDDKFHELRVPIQVFGPSKHTVAQRQIGPEAPQAVRR